jgi:hypothetical protein
MQAPRLNKIATRVIVLQTTADGSVTPITVYKEKRKKRSSQALRPAENMMKRMTDAAKAFADTMSDRFNDSRRKRNDGWLRDMGSNVFKAANKARKRMRLDRMPS